MNKILSFIALFFFILIGNTLQLYACTCSVPAYKTEKELVQTEYDNSSFVFVGKVLRIKKSYKVKTQTGFAYIKSDKVTLQIIQNLKGVNSKILIVKPSMTCGFGFRKGETYLVYANLVQLSFDDEGEQPAGKEIDVSACSRTRIFSATDKDLNFLREITDAKNVTNGNSETISC